MKTKLLIAYVLTIVSFLIPSSLHRPEHIGSIEKGIVPLTNKVEAHAASTFDSLPVIPITPQDYVRNEASRYGWHVGQEWTALNQLITNESGWQHMVYNKSSGACGLFQALPCSKLGQPLENVSNQAKWGLSYIYSRYGSPSKALNFWLYEAPKHNGTHWY